MPGPQALVVPPISNARIEFVEGLGIRKLVFKAALRGTDPQFLLLLCLLALLMLPGGQSRFFVI